MKWSLMRHSSTVLLAVLLLTGSARAEETSKRSSPLTPEQLQQQFERQQERLLSLERLVREQGLLLEQLGKQLAAKRDELVTVPSSAAVAASAVRGATATQEIQQLSGELEALAENTNQVTARVAHLEKDSKGLKTMLAEKPKGLGNIALSGDLRLRYEPFLGGSGADRHRARFRFRFTATSKFSQ